MGRPRGQFSFPIPGRRQKKQEKESAAGSSKAPQSPSAQQWPSHHNEPSSKAHRVLGTSEAPMFRTQSRQAMTINVSSESGYSNEYDDRASATATDYTRRPAMSKRPSSNILGNSTGDSSRRGSDNSTAGYRLHAQNSNSTMRSHYDAKNSPLSISQQTSNSAVRDMALRRGRPPVVTDGHAHTFNGFETSPISPILESERRKSKPAKLDLSKLFPKPTAGDGQKRSNLLSPNKMVHSPAAMSMNSEYFAQPMTREPTPAPKGHAKLTKHATRRHAEHAPPPPKSPKRLFKRDEYDNAKVHVRRPPKGVQHWFDALDEDSDEAPDSPKQQVHAPQARRPNNTPKIPLRKTSLGGLYQAAAPSHPTPRAQKSVPGFSSDSFSHDDIIDISGLVSPSQYSLPNSTKTKESSLSKHNLQDSSCLSFSSSEDEHDEDRRALRNFTVRKSINMDDDAGDIVFGQAQAFEVRPKRYSERKMSIASTSTSAATIDIMYTPEIFSPPNFSRVSNYSMSRRSSHLRQPSIILEDEDDRPRTSAHAPPSSSAYSIRSTRTSASEPHPRTAAAERKMMSVTPEEEALLELMRKKRASMAKQSSTSMSKTYTEQEDQRQRALEALQKTGRTSAFLANDSPAASPVKLVEMKSKRKSVAASSTSSAHLTPPPRGRSTRTSRDVNTTSTLRDSSVSDSEGFTFPIARGSLPHHIPTPGAFSPLDPFPPMFDASVASPTTIDHVSPLPSPVTPGPRLGHHDTVKIASSDTSADGDDVAVHETDLPVHIIKAAKSLETMESNHQRRRTASSGADMSFPVPPSFGAKDLAPVSEASISSRAPSIIEPPMPALPERSSKRAMALAMEQRSRQSSVGSNTSSRSHASSGNASSLLTGRERSRHASRGSSVASMTRSKARNSVSDDVLAAWGSLGGTY
jgi:hypothetical protein